jgi:hypothetical protein
MVGKQVQNSSLFAYELMQLFYLRAFDELTLLVHHLLQQCREGLQSVSMSPSNNLLTVTPTFVKHISPIHTVPAQDKVEGALSDQVACLQSGCCC